MITIMTIIINDDDDEVLGKKIETFVVLQKKKPVFDLSEDCRLITMEK